MEYRPLGQTDLNVSRVGFGCWAIGGHGWGHVNDDESIAAIRRALDLGVNFFDTADVYGFGHSESLLAAALGDDRHRVYIATKVGVAWDDAGRTRRDISPKRITAAIDASLRRLKLDSLPLLQVHWPDGKTPIADVMECLVRCRESGKIRWIGCCNFNAAELADAVGVVMQASIQLPYNLIDRRIEDALLPSCIAFDVPIITYGSLAHGALSGKYDVDTAFDEGDVRARSPYFSGDARSRNAPVLDQLRALGARHARTPAQVAVRWVLDQAGVACALTGAKTSEQIEENAGAMGWSLSVEELHSLDVVSRSAREGDRNATRGSLSGEE